MYLYATWYLDFFRFPNQPFNNTTETETEFQLWCSTTTEMKKNEKLNGTLDKIQNWLDHHNLSLNLKKSKIIEFRPFQKKTLNLQYIYSNTQIEIENTATLLGIEMDANISWKPHIHKLTKQISSLIYALIQLKKSTDFQSALTAYYTYIYSRLSYGIILWGNSSIIQDLFVLQKRCIRILFNISDQTISCKPYFIEYNILTLTSIYILECYKFVRKNPNLYTQLTSIKRKTYTN